MRCKLVSKLTASLVLSSLLFGCATHYQGDGIVLSAQKLPTTPAKHRLAKASAAVGGVAAAVPGVAIGSLIGAALSFAAPSNSIVVAHMLIGGAVVGGVFGLVGATAGAGIGLLAEQTQANMSRQQYSVRALKNSRIITVEQYSLPLPLNSRVKILERNGEYFIRAN